MTGHRHKRRRSGRGPNARTLWSSWCSCGWTCHHLTTNPHEAFTSHLTHVRRAEADRLMRQAPNG